jgi:hypothetical protein
MVPSHILWLRGLSTIVLVHALIKYVGSPIRVCGEFAINLGLVTKVKHTVCTYYVGSHSGKFALLEL